MIKKIFTVYDSAAQTYSAPMFEVATGAMVRSFEDECNNPESAMFKHPADYTLFELGTYDTDTAMFEQLEHSVNLGCALTFKEA